MNRAFVVEFDLDGPVILDRGINFAGLLARLIADRGETEPLAQVPLRAVDGIFAGSDLFVLGAAPAQLVSYVRSLRPTAMPHFALNDGRGRPLNQIVLRDGRKNLLDRRTATGAAALVAFGSGDPEAVEDLLAGIEHIGAKRSGGYGAVQAVRVTAIDDQPHAGFADRAGEPLRAVPVAVWWRLNLPPRPVRNLVARLPRWAAPVEACVGPRTWSLDLDAYERELAP
jgi:hypothetical protein